MVAVGTGPNGLRWTYQLATHETLHPTRVQLTDELLALRTLGDDLGLKLFLAGTVPLITVGSTIFPFRCCRWFRRWRLFLFLFTTISHLHTGGLRESIRFVPRATSIAESSSSTGVPLPSATIILMLLLILWRTSRSVLLEVIPVVPAVVSSTVVPTLSVVLFSYCAISASTMFVLPTIFLWWWRLRSRIFPLPAGEKLSRGWFQTGRLNGSTVGLRCGRTILDGSPAVELGDELLEALMVLLLLTSTSR